MLGKKRVGQSGGLEEGWVGGSDEAVLCNRT
ncbi:hypothetical protein MPNT_20150 [Candidatus Methylacidithermus pantelleriae]|uniref:Uncharacterized protein n=1 Tax=Candidatus Methylacidithermus pantelleriae TaxID=2744239 RepID=A0A8J2BSC6_9BACT|nr:hypothetical protein MPNT_20150 [Candidatus Methylacidithermus pantelleriae]